MLQNELEDIQLGHLKQFRTAFHTSLKLLCNYNSISKVATMCVYCVRVRMLLSADGTIEL